MRDGIHPQYVEATVTCACGYTFKTRSTKPVIRLELCSNCHPFFTGKQKLVDTTGTVEKFKRRFAQTEGKTVVRPKAAQKVKTPAKTKGKVLSTSARKQKAAAAPKKESSEASKAPKSAKETSKEK